MTNTFPAYGCRPGRCRHRAENIVLMNPAADSVTALFRLFLLIHSASSGKKPAEAGFFRVLCRTGNGVPGGLLALLASQFPQLALAHFQQAIGVDKIMVIMADGENGLSHLRHAGQ